MIHQFSSKWVGTKAQWLILVQSVPHALSTWRRKFESLFFPARSELVLFTLVISQSDFEQSLCIWERNAIMCPSFGFKRDMNDTEITLQLGQNIIFFFCRSVLCSLLNTKRCRKIPFRKASASFMRLWNTLVVAENIRFLPIHPKNLQHLSV